MKRIDLPHYRLPQRSETLRFYTRSPSQLQRTLSKHRTIESAPGNPSALEDVSVSVVSDVAMERVRPAASLPDQSSVLNQQECRSNEPGHLRPDCDALAIFRIVSLLRALVLLNAGVDDSASPLALTQRVVSHCCWEPRASLLTSSRHPPFMACSCATLRPVRLATF
jgi:hypothetical protein